MFNHQPPDYTCPFCNLLAGKENEYDRTEDIVFQNKFVTASIAPKWWINNPGHVLVMPNKHYENLYDIPEDILAEAYKMAKKVAIAIRSTYEDCEGVSTRQHNEPAGGQDVWHLHIHVFPRYSHDDLYKNDDFKDFHESDERKVYADKLRAYFAER